jgi:hypothetical protein
MLQWRQKAGLVELRSIRYAFQTRMPHFSSSTARTFQGSFVIISKFLME